jgi:hypothetical protein
MLKALTCETLHELDNGIAGEIINAELKKAIADLEDRGEQDEKPRSVVIEIEMCKYKGVDLINVKAMAKMPARRSNSTHAEGRYKEGVHDLFFQNLNAERADQPTFDAMEKLDLAGGEIPNQ